MNLKSKTAIVTGASSGLGRAIATALCNKGVKVFGLARNEERLQQIREEIGENFHPVKLDLTHEKEVRAWVEDTFSKNSVPDILINNAGTGSFHKIDETPSETWRQMIDINLNAIFYLTSAVVPLMKKAESSSHIINIGSILGAVTRTEASAYCATKFGINGFSEVLFKELRGFNIKVTCINPGSIDTHFFQTSGIKAHHNMLQPDELADTLVYVLETPDNFLINELTVRPLNPRAPKKEDKA